jgi:SnoaL-like domain
MDIQSLSTQVQNLQDIEAIKKLKYRYSMACDLGINEGKGELLQDVFVKDILWDISAFGKYASMQEVNEALKKIPEQMKFTYHFFTNPIIEVEGNKATGRWNVLAIYTMANGEDMILAGIEDDKYKKIEGRWWISEIVLTMAFFAPFKEGWSQLVMGQ